MPDKKQQYDPKKFLLDPEFHLLPEQSRKIVLSRSWPEFANGTLDRQKATLDTTLDEWAEIFKPKEPGFWDKIFGTEEGKPPIEPRRLGYDVLEPPPGSEPKRQGGFGVDPPSGGEEITLPSGKKIHGPPAGFVKEAIPASWEESHPLQSVALTVLEPTDKILNTPLLNLGKWAREYTADDPDSLGKGIFLGVADFIGGLTSVGSLATLGSVGAAMSGLKTLSPILKIAVEAGFSAWMGTNAVLGSAEAIKAYQAGDEQEFGRQMTIALGDAAFAYMSGRGAVKEGGALQKRWELAKANKEQWRFNNATNVTPGSAGWEERMREPQAPGAPADKYEATMRPQLRGAKGLLPSPAEPPAKGVLGVGQYMELTPPKDLPPAPGAAPTKGVLGVGQYMELTPPKALPPAPGAVTLPGGEPVVSRTTGIVEGEPGGLPPFKRTEKTLVGPEQGIPAPAPRPEVVRHQAMVTDDNVILGLERGRMMREGAAPPEPTEPKLLGTGLAYAEEKGVQPATKPRKDRPGQGALFQMSEGGLEQPPAMLAPGEGNYEFTFDESGKLVLKDRKNPASTSKLASPEEIEKAKETPLQSPYPVRGGNVTTPARTYNEAVALRPKGKPGPDQNVWVRQSDVPDNSNRTLMVQFASDLLQTAPPGPTGDYYDNLYAKRRGYDRPADFWELPQWQAHIANSLPEADHYTVRNVDEAIEFMNNAGYKNVAFSALDVNKDLITKIARGYDGRVVVGGYTDMSVFKDLPNVEVFPTVKDFVESEGSPYQEGYDYSLFNGTKTVPRLTLSDGCKHACVFCAVPKNLVEKSPTEIMQQVDAFARDLPSNLVYLNDKTFGQASNHTMLPEIYDRIKMLNPDFEGFVIQTTAAQVKKMTPEFIQRAGIKYIELGIESFNDPILKAHKKPANEKLIQEAADKIRDAGAILIPNIMVGLPGETPASYQRTLDWLDRNQDVISHVNVYNLALYTESELGRSMETRSAADYDENVIEKSWMGDAAPSQMFHRQILYFGNTVLGRDPARVRVLAEGFYGQPVTDITEAPPPSDVRRAGGPVKKTIVISTKPGNMPAFEVPLEELVARQERILDALGVTQDNPHIKQLTELGIEHTVVQPRGFGTWTGPEPNIRIEFPPAVPYAKVRQAAALLGEGFGQDGVAISHPDGEVQTYAGLKITKPDNALFTTEEVDKLARSTGITFEVDGPSLTFNMYDFASAGAAGKKATLQRGFLNGTIKALNEIGLNENNVGSYTGDSHLVERSAGDYQAGIGEIRDQARAEGRPDLPERLVRELRTALAAGHPTRAGEVAARRASEAAAEFDRKTLVSAPGTGQMDKLVSSHGGGSASGASVGEGAGSGLVSPPGWRELEGAIRGSNVRPTEAVAPSAILGPSVTVEEALRTKIPQTGTDLAEGQTLKGVRYGDRLATSPWTNINGRNVTVVDTTGRYGRNYLRLMEADPAVRSMIDLQGQLFDDWKVFMQDAYPGGDFQRAQYVGESVNWKEFAHNANGNRIFGNGGPCPVVTNSMTQLHQTFLMVKNGSAKEAEVPSFLASLMVETAGHEIAHQSYRLDDSDFGELLEKLRWQNRQFIEKESDKIRDRLSANNGKMIRDLIPQFSRYVNKTTAILESRRRPPEFAEVPDTFTETAVEVLAKNNEIKPQKTGKIVAPTIAELQSINESKGALTMGDLERTSAMTDLVAGLLGREGVTSEPKARVAFASHYGSQQYGNVPAEEFKRVYKAATIKASRNLPGLLPEEQELLTPADLVRIYEFGEKLEPMMRDFEALSKMGKITRGWYERTKESTTWLSYNLPGPSTMTPETKRLVFVKLLAALSPQQGVKDNFLQALRTWRWWADPQAAVDEFPDLNLHKDIVPFDTNVDHLKTLITTSIPEWEETGVGTIRRKYERDKKGRVVYDIDNDTGEKVPRVVYVSKGTVDLEARLNNTITALSGKGKFDITESRPDPDDPGKMKRVKIGEEWRLVGPLDLSGFKVTSFARNIWGFLQYMTLDTHMANMADISPKLVAKKGGYLALSNAFRQVAKNLGYEPAQMQETSWNPMRALFLLNNARKGGGGIPFDEGIKKITPDLLMELSANTELATMLLEDPDVAYEIERLGIDRAVREAQSDLKATTQLGRDLSDAETIDPGIFESIAERSERVRIRRASEKAKERARRGIEEPPSSSQLELFGTRGTLPGDASFEFGANEPDIESPAKSGLEPPPELAKIGKHTLPQKLRATDLGEIFKDFEDFDGGGWILPDGTAVKFNQFHYTSLAVATGLRAKDVIPIQKQLAAKYGLVRIRVTGQPSNPRPGAEIYGVPTNAQMMTISKMQKDLNTDVLFDVTDAERDQIFATGSGIGNLRRAIDEQFTDPVSAMMAGAPPPRPPGGGRRAPAPSPGLPPPGGRTPAGVIGGRTAIKPRPKTWVEAFRILFAPASRGPEAREAMGMMREHLAVRELKTLQAGERMKEAIEFFRWRENADNLEFIDNIEGAQPQRAPSPGPTGVRGLEARAAFRVASKFKKSLDSVDAQGLDNWANEMRALLDERVAQVRALGTGKLQNLIQNYFPHIWKDPAKASEFYGQYYAHKPFEGPKSFLMKRKIPTTQDGINAGLEPVTYNPAELLLLKLREVDRYVAAHKVMKDLETNGLLQTIPVGQRLPEGWTYIDDRIAKKFTRTPAGDLAISAQDAAPEPVARLLNNHLTPGLRGWKPYDQIRFAGNILNQVQLGMSAFHLTFTAIDAANSAAATALMRLTRGQFSSAAKAFAALPFRPVTAFMEGRKILNAALSGHPAAPEIQKYIDMAIKGGAGMKMDSFYDTGVLGQTLQALARGGMKGHLQAAARLPLLLIETASRPILDYLVPRMKLGVMADMIRFELDNMPQNASPEYVRDRMMKVVDSVDNRMGQLRYDNLGWNRSLKDILMASVRSVGWNLGTFREFGGAAGDTVEAAKHVAQGKLPPNIDHRQAYSIMTPILLAIAGAAFMVLHTGEWPENIKDLYFPKTGMVTPNGEPERVALPSYMKDLYAYSKHPLVTLSHKLHPLLSCVSDFVIRNEDFYGNQIRSTGDDPLWKQLTSAQTYIDSALYLAKQFVPFSVRNLEQRRLASPQKGLPAPPEVVRDIESFFGTVPAPGSVSKTTAEEVLDKRLSDRMPKGSKSQIEAKRREEMRDLMYKYRTGGHGAAEKKIASSEYLRPSDIKLVEKKAGMTKLAYGAKMLGLDDVLDVYEAADEDERKELVPILKGKTKLLKGRSRAEREAILDRIEELGLTKSLFGANRVPRKLPAPPP